MAAARCSFLEWLSTAEDVTRAERPIAPARQVRVDGSGLTQELLCPETWPTCITARGHEILSRVGQRVDCRCRASRSTETIPGSQNTAD